ncbi:hypothetical protein BgiMline_019350 [Biomphalaria glabrata]
MTIKSSLLLTYRSVTYKSRRRKFQPPTSGLACFGCLKADLSSSPHIPVQAEVPGPVCTYYGSKPTAWHPHPHHTSACLPAGHQQLAARATELQLTPPRRRTLNTDK